MAAFFVELPVWDGGDLVVGCGLCDDRDDDNEGERVVGLVLV